MSSNKVGCEDSVVKKIYISPEVFIKVPNIFSPNNDGNNDLFFPFHAGITKLIIFRVYNRWGELVYETNDILKGWNGNFRGKEQDVGTYVYYIIANTADREGEVVIKGNFSLIR